MIKTINEVWKKLTGFDNSQDIINARIDRIENELKTAIKELKEHQVIEQPSIVNESLKHDIDVLNTTLKDINTRLDQIDTRAKKEPENEVLTEKELFDLQYLSKEKSEYHKLKEKANRIYEKTGYVPPGFMVDAKKKLRRSLNMKGKSLGKPNLDNQKSENKKPRTIFKEFAFKGREKTDIGILDTPN
jgi:hypothetical protein